MTHDDDRSLTQALEAAREAGRRCALATIVATKGSTPRKVGARMIVDPDTGLVGTVGGGCGEAEVIEAAYRVIETGNCLLYTSPSPRDKRQSRMPSSA